MPPRQRTPHEDFIEVFKKHIENNSDKENRSIKVKGNMPVVLQLSTTECLKWDLETVSLKECHPNLKTLTQFPLRGRTPGTIGYIWRQSLDIVCYGPAGKV